MRKAFVLVVPCILLVIAATGCGLFPGHAAGTPTPATPSATPTTVAPASPTTPPSRTPPESPTIVAHCYDPVFGGVTGCPGRDGPLRIATRLDCSWSAGAAPGIYHVRARLSAEGRPMRDHGITWTIPEGVGRTDDTSPIGRTNSNGVVALTLTVATVMARPIAVSARFAGTRSGNGISTVGEPSTCALELP